MLNNHFEYDLHWNESRSQVLIKSLRLFKAKFLRSHKLVFVFSGYLENA